MVRATTRQGKLGGAAESDGPPKLQRDQNGSLVYRVGLGETARSIDALAYGDSGGHGRMTGVLRRRTLLLYLRDSKQLHPQQKIGDLAGQTIRLPSLAQLRPLFKRYLRAKVPTGSNLRAKTFKLRDKHLAANKPTVKTLAAALPPTAKPRRAKGNATLRPTKADVVRSQRKLIGAFNVGGWTSLSRTNTFASPKLAALDFAKSYNTDSIQMDKELGATIFSIKLDSGEVRYAYNQPMVGFEACVVPNDALPDDAVAVSTVHTHAHSHKLLSSTQYIDEVPGSSDLLAVRDGVDHYVCTPEGKLIAYGRTKREAYEDIGDRMIPFDSSVYRKRHEAEPHIPTVFSRSATLKEPVAGQTPQEACRLPGEESE